MAEAPVKWWEEKKEPETIWQACTTPEGQEYYFNTETNETSWEKPEELMTEEEKETLQGEWYWIPDRKLAFVPGKLMSQQGQVGTFQLEDGESKDAKITKLEPLKKSSLKRVVEDLVLLDRMSAPLILHNLRARFENDQIYTNVGTIVISINPYFRLPLYTAEIKDKYIHRGMKTDFAPHVYNIGYAAYKGLSDFGLCQSVIISGESGAGKTEATKQVLSFLAKCAGSVGGIEKKVLQANPILEAFGNAKTVRNDNSSRFGKYMEIFFNNDFKINGSKTKNYLLEKIRVTKPMESERNFHIFYQLAKCASPAERKKYQLLGRETDYKYLTLGGCTEVDTIDDAAEFKDVKQAFNDLAFSSQEVDQLLQVVSAVMCMGNISFGGTNDRATMDSSSDRYVNTVSSILGMDSKALHKALLVTVIHIPRQPPTDKHLGKAGAADVRDALAKFIYDHLFDWLVKRVNQSMGTVRDHTRYIGILDIFGFEIFKKNSFEQLCINFTNEMLQQHFNTHTFKLEEQVYQREEIKFAHVEFVDNKPMIDLITKKPRGVLPMLDEEGRVPKGSDRGFIQKLHKAQGRNNVYKKVIKNPNQFIIKHYAGPVKYDSTGFLNKNKDTISQDLLDLISSSGHPLLQVLFPASEYQGGGSNKQSLGSQFAADLSRLRTQLNSTEPHYIRCVKPNGDKAPRHFVSKDCLEQLTYSGVFEAVSIRKQGYPFRLKHDVFAEHYKSICVTGSNNKAKCLNICRELKLDMTNVQVGKTMMLYRADEHKKLELIRGIRVTTIKINQNLERLIKVNHGRMNKAQKEEFFVDLALGVRQADDFRISSAPAEQARKLLENFIEQRMDPETKRMLQAAKRSMDQGELEAVLFRCNENGYRTKDTRACQALLEKVVDCEAAMRVARSELDQDFLERALGMADEFDYTAGTVGETRELLEKVVTAKEMLAQAMGTKDHEELEYVLGYCADFGYNTPSVGSAQDLLTKVLYVRETIDAAMAAVEQESLSQSIAMADDLEYNSDLVESARVLLYRVSRINEECESAGTTLEEDQVRACIAAAQEIGMRTDWIDYFESLANGDYGAFLAEQFKKAKELKADDRAIRISIAQKDHWYTTADAKRYSDWTTYDKMRTPTEWASSRLMGIGAFVRTEVRARRMYCWQKDTMHGAMQNISAADAKDTKRTNELKKMAKAAHLSLQVHMGDKKDKEPAKKLEAAVSNALVSPEVRTELYLQVLKMIHPGIDDYSAFPTSEAKDKAWELMALYLTVFPPAEDFENFLEVIFRNDQWGSYARKYRCDGLLRRRVYLGPKNSAPMESQMSNVVSIISNQRQNDFIKPEPTDPSWADLMHPYEPYQGGATTTSRRQPEPEPEPEPEPVYTPEPVVERKTAGKTRTGGKKKGGKKKGRGKARGPPKRKPPPPKPVRNPWVAVLDEESGDTYYWNEDTNETTWETPPGMP